MHRRQFLEQGAICNVSPRDYFIQDYGEQSTAAEYALHSLQKGSSRIKCYRLGLPSEIHTKGPGGFGKVL